MQVRLVMLPVDPTNQTAQSIDHETLNLRPLGPKSNLTLASAKRVETIGITHVNKAIQPVQTRTKCSKKSLFEFQYHVTFVPNLKNRLERKVRIISACLLVSLPIMSACTEFDDPFTDLFEPTPAATTPAATTQAAASPAAAPRSAASTTSTTTAAAAVVDEDEEELPPRRTQSSGENGEGGGGGGGGGGGWSG